MPQVAGPCWEVEQFQLGSMVFDSSAPVAVFFFFFWGGRGCDKLGLFCKSNLWISFGMLK